MNQFLQTAKELLFEITFAIGAIALFFLFILAIIWVIWYFSNDRKNIDRETDIEDEDMDYNQIKDVRMDHFIKQEPWTTN